MALQRTTTLPGGQRVRLRLPGPSDRARLREFLARLGIDVDDLALGRLVRFDPRGRTAVCAALFDGTGEAIVGYGAIDRFADDPDLLLADEELAPGVADAVAECLRDRAASHVA